MTQIYTKWHHVAESFKKGNVGFPFPNKTVSRYSSFDWFVPKHMADMIQLGVNTQHYVFDNQVTQLLLSDGGQRSLHALYECGITDIPHRTLAIEYILEPTAEVGRQRQFAIVGYDTDKGEGRMMGAMLAYSEEHDYIVVPPIYVEMRVVKPNKFWGIEVVLHAAPWCGKGFEAFMEKRMGATSSIDDYVDVAEAIAQGYQDATLLLHTKGIGKEVVTSPGKLNKSRAAAGKTLIPTHTVIRIGKVYDRSGKEVVHTGRHMRVHWRAGHARSQVYGPRTSPKHRMIYIEPVLVNYDPAGGEAPSNIPHIVVARGRT